MEERKSSQGAKANRGDQELISKWLYMAIGVVVALAAIAIWSYVDEFGSVRSHEQEVWGQFGDFIGGVFNPLLSFLALLAVLASLKSQSLELRAAREEASTAMDIQTEQTKIFKSQSDLIEKQRFESSFYGLLDLKLKVAEELAPTFTSITTPPPTGLALLRRLAREYQVDRLDFSGVTDSAAAYNHFVEHCRKFFNSTKGTLERYVSVLELLLEYVDSYKGYVDEFGVLEFSTMSQVAKNQEQLLSQKFYADIVVALLSSEEVECLYLYMTGSDKKNLRYFSEKFDLFRNLPLRNNYAKFSLVEQVKINP